MNHLRVHYNATTGGIIAWDNAHGGEPLMGGRIATFEIPDGHEIKIDPTSMRIDLLTLELEDLSEAEIDAARGPSLIIVQEIIERQLISTDGAMAPDRYVKNRDAWITYRQTLRDLSKPQDQDNPTQRPTPAEMVAAFPVRPDGIDAVKHLRASMEQG